LARYADQSRQGTHVDDVAVTLASHDRPHCICDTHRTPESRFSLFQTRFLNHAGVYLSRVVDENVLAARAALLMFFRAARRCFEDDAVKD